MMRAGRPAARVLGFAANQANKVSGQRQRRHQQRRVVVGLRVRGQVIEDAVHLAVISGSCGQQAEVGIEARRVGVVIAGAEVRVAPRHAIRIAPHQQRQLAVRLQAHNAVKDLHARIFKIARPANIRGFVEARHQFDDDRDFLALRGFDQGGEHRRIGAGAIERLLDGDDIRVFRCRLQ